MIFQVWTMMILEEENQVLIKNLMKLTAILAGDALHDFAFQLLSGSLTKINEAKNLELINYLTFVLVIMG